MHGSLVQVALVFVLLWAESRCAKPKTKRERIENVGKTQSHSFDVRQEEISIPRHELGEGVINEEQLTRELSYETAWTKNGKRRVTILNAEISKNPAAKGRPLPSSSVRKNPKEVPATQRRTKRKIFDIDNRLYVPSKYTQVFPFRTTVKISTGCTGTLISTLHVLTSAHCIHSGKGGRKGYEPGFRSLSVGFLQRNRSVIWVTVSQTNLPLAWTLGLDKDASRYDYAILKLSKKHARGFLPIGVSEGETYGSGQRIQFTAFEDDKPSNTMWYRYCEVTNTSKNMLFHCCDAKPGSSGAGVYIYFFDNQTSSRVRKVIGIFSGNRFVYNRPDWPRCRYGIRKNSDAINYNAAIRITSLKFRQMCQWMSRHGGVECRKVLKQTRRTRRRRRNRHRHVNGQPK